MSKTLAQNKHVSITIFAFDKDEEISTHDSDGDAMVNVLEGKGKFVIDGKEYIVNAGGFILLIGIMILVTYKDLLKIFVK